MSQTFEEPKDKMWKVTRQDVGRELGNPNWVLWAMNQIAAQAAGPKCLDCGTIGCSAKGTDKMPNGCNEWSAAAPAEAIALLAEMLRELDQVPLTNWQKRWYSQANSVVYHSHLAPLPDAPKDGEK